MQAFFAGQGIVSRCVSTLCELRSWTRIHLRSSAVSFRGHGKSDGSAKDARLDDLIADVHQAVQRYVYALWGVNMLF